MLNETKIGWAIVNRMVLCQTMLFNVCTLQWTGKKNVLLRNHSCTRFFLFFIYKLLCLIRFVGSSSSSSVCYLIQILYVFVVDIMALTATMSMLVSIGKQPLNENSGQHETELRISDRFSFFFFVTVTKYLYTFR